MENQLLRQRVHSMINHHGLAEVLDRLAQWCHDSAELEADEGMKAQWSQLTMLLEQATENSLKVRYSRDLPTDNVA